MGNNARTPNRDIWPPRERRLHCRNIRGEMPMRRSLIVLAALFVAAAAPPIKPGQWEIANTITAIDMPSDPGGIAKSMVGRTTVMKNCVTPAQVAAGPEGVFKATGGKCRYDKLTIAGGRIEGAMSCPGTLSSTVSGTMTPTAYQLTGRTKTAMMTMTSMTKGRWLGPC